VYRSIQTKFVITIHTTRENGFGGGSEGGAFIGGQTELFELVSFDSTKQFGPASGQWTITLKRGKGSGSNKPAPSPLDLWKDPEDVWLGISAMINGKLFDVTLGLVDSISEDTFRGGSGERSETFTVTGRDFGKVFEQTNLFVNIFERGGIIPTMPLYDAMWPTVLGTPATITLALIRAWVGNNGLADSQWMLPPSLYGGSTFYNALNKSTISESVRGDTKALGLLQPDPQGRQLWDALQEYANLVLNELWVDLAPDPGRSGGSSDLTRNPVNGRMIELLQVRGLRPAVYLRERPFPSSEFEPHEKWTRLPTHDLFPEDISARQIVKGGAQHRFNYWMLTAAGSQAGALGHAAAVQSYAERSGGSQSPISGRPGQYPIYDIDDIRRHGLRKFSQSTRFLPLQDPDIGALFIAVSSRWLKLVHDWYVVAPLEFTGTLTSSYLMPWIRIGHRVREVMFDGKRIVYYVEGVHHHYSYPGPGSTAITVTRGEPSDRDFLHEVYERIESRSAFNDLSHRAPGLETASTEDARAVREGEDTVTAPEDRVEGLQLDPAGAVGEEEGAGGERTGATGRSMEASGDSQQADPSMNPAAAPQTRLVQAGTRVVAVDDPDNPPPSPTERREDVLQLDDTPEEDRERLNELIDADSNAAIPEPME